MFKKVKGIVHMKVGFARVSTQEQYLKVQLSKLDEFGYEKIFHGKQTRASIKNDDKLKDHIRFHSTITDRYSL